MRDNKDKPGGTTPRERKHSNGLIKSYEWGERMSETFAKYQDQEIKELLQRTARLEKGLENIEGKLDIVIAVRDIAVEANQSTKSAHLRIDAAEKSIRTTNDDLATEEKRTDGIEKALATQIECDLSLKKRVDKLETALFWFVTTAIITLLGIIGALAKIFVGGNLNG